MAHVFTGEQRKADPSSAKRQTGTLRSVNLDCKPPDGLKDGETDALSIERLGMQKQKVVPCKG